MCVLLLQLVGHWILFFASFSREFLCKMSGYTVIYAYNLPRLRNIGWMASRTYVACGIQFSSTFFKLITVKREKMQKNNTQKTKNAIMGNAQCKVHAKLLHRANQLVTKAYAITFTVITYYCRV